jgi:hypothetical protein
MIKRHYADDSHAASHCKCARNRILDIERVLGGEIEIEAMDSHNNWFVFASHHARVKHRSCRAC